MSNVLRIAGHEFKSRLFLGTGKFASGNDLKNAINESETELVTVAPAANIKGSARRQHTSDRP